MKYVQFLIYLLLLVSCKKRTTETVDTQDIQIFWNAYDQVKNYRDTIKQVKIIDSLYFKKASKGLLAICEARRYTPKSYIEAINKYPKYWESVRNNTLKAHNYTSEINQGIDKLKEFYPELKPAKIYFTIGALRTGGTTLKDKVLIGAEIALADSQVVTHELQEDYPHLVTHFKTNNPEKNIAFTNIHEYVHTQQDTTIANSLLSRVLIEGVAEFVAEKSMGVNSPTKSVIFGKKNDKIIKDAFVKEMFTQFEVMWFWGNANNQFKIPDLGYYVGYAICKSYYKNASDKKQAIKKMIELDYLDKSEIYTFINESKYFIKTLEEYKEEFENKRPKVVRISEFKNQSINLSADIKTMTIEFSESMNPNTINLRLGPLGESNLLKIIDVIGWSDNGKKFSVKIKLEPKLRQQILITDIFRSKSGYLLEPYLIDITTK